VVEAYEQALAPVLHATQEFTTVVAAPTYID